jgi:phage tail-like protein
MATGDRIDPYRGYNFVVQLDGTNVAGFSELGGLSFSREPVDYREGTDVPLHPRRLTGLSKFENLTLKRGFTDNRDLWNWWKNILNGKEDRRSGSFILRNEEHDEVLRWDFEDAWICKWEGPAFNATSNDVVIEAIELCVYRVELV